MSLLQVTAGSPPLDFVQGDEVVLTLQATDDLGNPVNITGASFSSQIVGPNGNAIATFGNGQHSITTAAQGIFTLTLATTDTSNCGEGPNKQIWTQITIGGNPTTYRGMNILTVYPPSPTQ